MTKLEMGLMLNRIAVQLDDENYERIKPDWEKVKVEIVRLYEIQDRLHSLIESYNKKDQL